jgi:AbrB family looped-hinge helix DNA binding protein
MAFAIVKWHNEAVKARVDKFGRIVIPLRLREKTNLAQGSEVEIDEEGGRIYIEPVHERAALARDEDGVLVLHAELPQGIDPVALQREERLRLR